MNDESQPALTRRIAAECDDVKADNERLREQVKQFKASISYASVTIAVLRSQVDDLTAEVTRLKAASDVSTNNEDV